MTVTARQDQEAPVDNSVRIVIQNLPDEGVYVELEFTEDGLSSANFFQVSDSEATLELKFKTPAALDPGIYVDQLTVRACYDENCRSIVSGSPVVLQVTYTVEPTTTMTLDRHVVSAGSTLGGSAPPIESVRVSFDAAPSTGVFVSVALREFSPVPSIESASIVELSPTERRIDIRWKDPDEVGESSRGAEIRVRACYDRRCLSQVTNGEQIFNTRYRVSRFPIAVTRGFDIGAKDMAFDPVSGMIYMVLSSTAQAHPNTIVAFDPVSGAITSFSPAGNEPKLVAVSQDGSKVYVGLSGANEVRRFSAPELVQDLRIALPLTGMPHLVGADQIAVAPGAPQSLAVSDEGRITIYDDSTPRTGASGNTPVPTNTVEWGDTDRVLYSSNNDDTGFEFWALDVGPFGVQTRIRRSGILDGFCPRIHYAHGLVYSDFGVVIDSSVVSVIGRLAPQSNNPDRSRRVALDSIARVAFMAGRNSSIPSDVRQIDVFDMDTYAAIRTFEVLGANGDPERILRWGDNGIALLSSTGQLLIFQDPGVQEAVAP